MKKLTPDVFFQLSPDLLCIATYEGYFKELSPSWQHVTGWTLDELYAKPYVEFVHPEDRVVTQDTKDRLVAGEEVFRRQPS